MSYNIPPSDPFENELYEAREHERDQRRDRDARFHEPLLSQELRESAHETYPQLVSSKAASDEHQRRMKLMDEIAWHEAEIERLKTETDEPITDAPF